MLNLDNNDIFRLILAFVMGYGVLGFLIWLFRVKKKNEVEVKESMQVKELMLVQEIDINQIQKSTGSVNLD